MNIFKFIKEFFSFSDIPEPQLRNRYDDEGDDMSYYVPPMNDEKMTNDNSQIDSSNEDYSLERVSSHNLVDCDSDIDVPQQFELTMHDDNDTVSDEPSDTSSCEASPINENEQKPDVIIDGIGEDICEIIHEFDSYLLQTDSNDVKQTIEVMQYRLIEVLCKNGITPIDNDTSFNSLRHVSVPFAIIPEGTPIKEFKRIGLLFNNTVLLKAQVIV